MEAKASARGSTGAFIMAIMPEIADTGKSRLRKILDAPPEHPFRPQWTDVSKAG